jgi:zinc/manganese transport system substrate-binding protein
MALMRTDVREDVRRSARPGRLPLATSLKVGLSACLSATLSAPAAALTVFACEPEWAALARTLLPQVRVHVATHAGQDPHHIEARPALIAQLRSADLAVCTGASLESGWLPVLQQRAGKGREQDVFFAADHVKLLDPQPGAVGTPWAGDVHAEGNPHLHADPRNLRVVAGRLAERLQQEVPAQKASIAQRLAEFDTRLANRIAQWERRATPLRGRSVAAQHATFGYLWHWLGLQLAADLEPKPGMGPTPGHLQRVLETLRPRPPTAVVIASYQDPRPGRWLASQLPGQVPLVVLPATVAEDADGEALLAWFDTLLSSLLQAATR